MQCLTLIIQLLSSERILQLKKIAYYLCRGKYLKLAEPLLVQVLKTLFSKKYFRITSICIDKECTPTVHSWA